MNTKGLNTNERVLITSDNVRIKGRLFTAVLTEKRLVLTDYEGERIEYDTDSFGKVSLSDTGESIDIDVEGDEIYGNLSISFPGEPPRSDELNDWASALHIQISRRSAPESIIFEPQQTVIKKDDIDTLYEGDTGPKDSLAGNKKRIKSEKKETKEKRRRAKEDRRREKKDRKSQKTELKGFDDEEKSPVWFTNVFGYLYTPGRMYGDSASSSSILKAAIYFLVCSALFSVLFSFIQFHESGIAEILRISSRMFSIFIFCMLIFGVFLHLGIKVAAGKKANGICSTYKAVMFSVMPFLIIGWFSYDGIYYGILIAIIWSVAIMIRGLSVLHVTSVARAFMAFLIALILAGFCIFIVNKAFFLADKIEEFNMLKSGINITSTVSSPATTTETVPVATATASIIVAIPTMKPVDEFEKITVTGQAVVAGVSDYTPIRTSSQLELPHFEPASGPQSIDTINHTFRYQNKEITVSIPIDYRIYLGATQGNKGAIVSSDLSQQDWEPDYYRSFIEQSDLYTLYDSIAGALQQVKSKMKLDEDEYAELITVYVQSLPYEHSKIIWAPKFPIETVYEGKGDCDDKSILLNALLAEEGYNSAFLSFGEEEHMATGIKSTAGSYKNTGYAFIETSDVDYIGTIPIGLETGVKLVSNPLVIKTGESTGKMYYAYQDTQTLRDSLQKAWDEQESLKQDIDAKWKILSDKMSEMENMKLKMDEYKGSGDFENYNLLVAEYNALYSEYTHISDEYSIIAKRYEALGELARNINERRYDRPGVYSYLRQWEDLVGWAS